MSRFSGWPNEHDWRAPRSLQTEQRHDDRLPRGSRRRVKNPERKGGSPLEFLLITLISLVFVFGVVRPFVVEAFFIPSESMAPTLQEGDRVLAAKFAYRFADPERGELVAFKDPENGDQVDIKRVVGLPKDTVAIRDGVLFVNGEPRREPYVNHRLTDANFFGPKTVPKGHVFVMGDNRSNSRDSRFFGPVPEEDLLGRVSLRFWPLDRAKLL